MKVVIAGGTGVLGRRLAGDFADHGDEVVILTRSPRSDVTHRQVQWDGRTVGPWSAELEDAIVVNLAGELVDRRPTPQNVALLRASRVEPTRALVAAASGLVRPPALWLQMSTLAIYGDAGPDLVDEVHPVADGPPQMAGVAVPWEHAVQGVAAERLVVMRTGIVLDRDTPAVDRLARLTKLFLGGRISTGEQWISWVHATDFRRAVAFIREHDDLDGVVHLTSPHPIQNRDMMASLRQALHRPWSPPTPKPLVHLGALFMRTDPALALTGRRCVPRRLAEAGFEFQYPTFDAALAELIGRTAT
ncbi:MAG: TIGR01777 family oxidoreductase [Actinomycetota bacterium]|nr:TIGR01777 family protein [Acidimicrobiia bacterium]MDQ3292829.1 TIGR01777 family oxidoreductase [Actinomycetota bacterium]